ncbi:MAG: hypothetical protein IJ491_09295 [Clostridia bacterium]|nr:hypothetical protein [Clostridia bacterium]
MTDNLDKLIEEYSQKLMTSIPRDQLRKSSINTSPEPQEPPTQEALTGNASPAAESSPVEEIGSDQEKAVTENETEKQPEEIPKNTNEPQPIPTDPDNFSTFLARVFTGGGAFAVPEAKVVIYRGDVLHSFLTTDESGETKQIKLEAYPEENSLEPLSDEQRLNYSADVFADGFTARKGLLVSAVGGADIILNVELIPESEGIN